ncbi:MAG: EamA family transporter, partial [Rhodobacteraceae bacterium]|nr:EamA family transporter [Paracoccaceae bacterium]
IGAFLGLLAAALALRAPLPLKGAPYGVLAVMGLCDATALGLVQSAGTLPRPEFAAVASSTFGMVTILLAWAFLKERMSTPQWGAVALVFAGIGYLAL